MRPFPDPEPPIDRSPNPDQLLEEFEQRWRQGSPLSVEDFLAARAPASDGLERRRLLEELILIDLDYRWRQAVRAGGQERPLLQDYLPRFPEVGAGPGPSLSLIGSEYRIRRHWGDRPTHEEYRARFPGHESELARQLTAVDAELAGDENAEGDMPLAVPVAPVVSGTGLATESLGSVTALMDVLRQAPLLTPAQFDEIVREEEQGRFTDPRGLAGELLRRGWLTPYQVDRLVLGQGAELVVDSYVLLERLGEGGTGEVFKAWHRRLDRQVALKVIRKELLTDPEVVSRFYREIRLVSQLASPHIVHAYDAGAVGRAHFLTMEYVEGTDLRRLVRTAGPLPCDRAADYIRQAALGLQHLHEQHLVHRDVKPSNLFLSGPPSAGLIKILDLGLGRWCAPRDSTRGGAAPEGNSFSTLTPAGSVMVGTPDYLAPEQALDFHAADIRADIYSLGCTLYYLLSAQPPFAGGTLTQKLLRHQQEPVPPLEQLRTDLPAGLGAVLSRMLAKRPENRYQTPAEVAEALGNLARVAAGTNGTTAVQAGVALTARELLRDPAPAGDRTSPTGPKPVARRSWRPAVWGSGVLLLCLGIFVWLLATSLRPPDPHRTDEEIAPAPAPLKTPSWSIWSQSGETPQEVADGNPGRGVELGVKFRVEVKGVVTGIRFYKTPRNTGRHSASLWSRSGERLAHAVFTNETASGWQQADFVPPVPVETQTTYVASYHLESGYYAHAKEYFAARGSGRGPLRALANGVDGPNGVFKYAAAPECPVEGFVASNYWVDVAFSPAP